MKVAVLAEGAGEIAGSGSYYPDVGVPLPDHAYGAAHLLVLRLLRRVTPRPEDPIEFIGPLRSGAAHARGTMLHAPRRLERLCAWPRPDVRPDLQVVFIDEDGDRARSETLRPFVGSPFVAGVLAVAVPEFEGWLIADPQAVSRASGHTFQQPPDVETMRRREPRRRLDDHQTEEPDERRHAVRLEIAKCLDLDHVAKACSSFGRFVRDLEEAVTRIPRR